MNRDLGQLIVNVLLAVAIIIGGLTSQVQDRHIDRLEHRIEILESSQ